MDTLNEFQKMMAEQTDLALATIGTDGIPNVRVVNYYFNPENNIVYFATFKNNVKVKEMKQNQNVAFTTIPKEELLSRVKKLFLIWQIVFVRRYLIIEKQ